MNQRQEIGGGSIAARLCTIALVPMLALGFTSYRQIERDQIAAEASTELAESVDLQRHASAVIAPASLERVALEGLARVDVLGVDRSFIPSFTGIDLDAVSTENSDRLDKSLQDLRRVGLDATLADGTPLTVRIDQLTSDIAQQRQLSQDRVADPSEVAAVFDQVSATLTQLLTETQAPTGAAIVGLDDAAKLQALSRAAASAGALTQTVMGSLLYEGPTNRDAVVRASAAHETHLDTIEVLLDREDRVGLSQIRSARPDVPLILLDTQADDPVIANQDSITQITIYLVAQLEYLDAFDSYSAALQLDLSDVATVRASDASQAVTRSTYLVVAVALLSIVLTASVLITTARPLARLSRRAADVSDGDLNMAPLPLRGPHVVRRLTKSVNDMLVTLAGVDAQIAMMSTGNLSAANDVELPGAIGVSMRQSVARLSSVTEQLAHQARHDLLTGLPNRFAAMECLDNLLGCGQRFALLFVDIDGFKGVNDTLGHETGDQVLREVARRLSTSTRTNEFVARLGGDEFVVIVYDDVDDATQLGHRLIQEVEQPYGAEEGIFALSASIGVVTPDSGVTSVEALHQADTALYLAKHRGRGRVERFDADLQAKIEHEADLALALRHGVRNGELVLHFQPVMSLDTGRMDHAEALVRWNRPNIGLVAPGEFIPIAERSSLIFEIERWVLHRSCEVLASWRERVPDCKLRLAVNISGRHLIEGDLLGDLDTALQATGADPSMLEFELTETHLLEDLEIATSLLNTIRSRGIAIAVDDFGTGYSSMNYLRDLPIDTIKIDRSFVARSTEKGYDSTVIEAVLTIARSLGLSVVAEGIETHEQLHYVRTVGCHRAQGYLLARPTPLSEAETVLFGADSHGHQHLPVASAHSADW